MIRRIEKIKRTGFLHRRNSAKNDNIWIKPMGNRYYTDPILVFYVTKVANLFHFSEKSKLNQYISGFELKINGFDLLP